jgi:anti-sigma B factor antagonist
MLRYVAYRALVTPDTGPIRRRRNFPLRFDVSSELVGDRACVLRVEGEVDISTAESLRAHLAEALAAEPAAPVICDLAEVAFLDSVGIGVLVAAFDQAATHGRAFCVAGARGQVRRTLELVRLVELLPCFSTVPEALDADSGAWTSAANSR